MQETVLEVAFGTAVALSWQRAITLLNLLAVGGLDVAGPYRGSGY